MVLVSVRSEKAMVTWKVTSRYSFYFFMSGAIPTRVLERGRGKRHYSLVPECSLFDSGCDWWMKRPCSSGYPVCVVFFLVGIIHLKSMPTRRFELLPLSLQGW